MLYFWSQLFNFRQMVLLYKIALLNLVLTDSGFHMYTDKKLSYRLETGRQQRISL